MNEGKFVRALRKWPKAAQRCENKHKDMKTNIFLKNYCLFKYTRDGNDNLELIRGGIDIKISAGLSTDAF